MKIQEVRRIVGNLPHMTLRQAETITQFIADQHIEAILELGFEHGVSTCYMAAALKEAEVPLPLLSRRGSIVTIDLEEAREATPDIEELLNRIGERHRVKVFYEPTSYTWRLMKFLEEDSTPRFDLCYVDAAHSWFVDALGFFLVDRLLRPSGWIIFDDVDWTYAKSPALKKTEAVHRMPLAEQTTPQVRKIYELLVKTHPGYHNFRLEAGWAFAQKRNAKDLSTPAGQREIVTEQIVRIERVGLGGFLLRVADKIRGR
jgi:predicted O-methyltransferase YrrM